MNSLIIRLFTLNRNTGGPELKTINYVSRTDGNICAKQRQSTTRGADMGASREKGL